MTFPRSVPLGYVKDDPADLWENITPVSPAEFAAAFTPIGYQGAAQHTYTPGCDGFHEPGPCPTGNGLRRLAPAP